MIFIFEDYPDSDISLLYKAAYSSEYADKFVYAEGNGNLKSEVMKYLLITSEKIVVFLDTIPGNRACYMIYRELCYISKNHDYRVIVLPIICAEYYMIKSIRNKQLFLDLDEVNNCINKKPHTLSNLMKCDGKAKFCKNFEKYCKYILKFNTRECLKPYVKLYAKNGEYYRSACMCDRSDTKCSEITLLNKAINLLIAYKYFPSGSEVPDSVLITENKMWDVHRILVDEYNEFVDAYRLADAAEYNNYKKIKYIVTQ